jgi:hypothetical protein
MEGLIWSPFVFRLWGSERLIVGFGVGIVGAGMQMLFAAIST